MTSFQSRIDTGSEQFERQREEMLELVGQLRKLEQRAVELSNKRRETFEKRGQIVPHERIARLLDPGMPFLRLFTLANYLVEDPDPETSVPGANMIAGIGFISGVRCMIWADDSGIKAGSYTLSSVPAVRGILEMAKRQKLPLVHLVESAGANLMDYQIELWAEGGGMFRRLAELSAAGIPTTTVLHGPSTAGGAYMPGMSDYVVGIKNNGLAALGGAALVQAATGEIADERQLGGSEMHASVSGVVEFLAEDDAHGLAMTRDLIDRLDWNARAEPPPTRPVVPPRYDADELAGVVPVDPKAAYDVREVLARVVDGSDFEEFKSRYGAATVCVRTNIMGHACGIIGNNGPFDPDGATKATQFFQLCDQADLPIIFLNNTTGYMVGTEYEQAGMIKHGSKMIQAVTNVRVPRITLYIGASYGAGNYGMCGYAYDPDFLFAWPNANTGVMGGEQAAKTMRRVTSLAAERRGQPVDEEALQALEAKIIKLFDRQANAFYSSGRVLDHGIIDPRDTRKVLGFCLDTVKEARARRLQPNSFGVGRM